MASPIEIIQIKDQKLVYLVECKNKKGEIRNDWLDEDAIKFMYPEFLDRLKAGTSENDEKEDSTYNETAAVEIDEEESNELKCKECGLEYKRRDHLKDHIRKKHSATMEEYTCPECSSKFGYRQNWKQHMTRKHKWSGADAEMVIDVAKKIVDRPKNEIEDSEDDLPLAVRKKNNQKRKANRLIDEHADATQPPVKRSRKENEYEMQEEWLEEEIVFDFEMDQVVVAGNEEVASPTSSPVLRKVDEEHEEVASPKSSPVLQMVDEENEEVASPEFSPVLRKVDEEHEEVASPKSSPVLQKVDEENVDGEKSPLQRLFIPPSEHLLRSDTNESVQEGSTELVVFDQLSITEPPLQFQTPLRFFIEPSTFINLASFIGSFCMPSTLPSFPVERSSNRFPVQPLTMFEPQGGVHFNSQEMQLTMPHTMPVQRSSNRLPLQQRTMVSDWPVGMSTESQQPTFSESFTSEREFGITKTVTVANNKMNVSQHFNITVTNDAFQQNIDNYLDGLRRNFDEADI